jgi:GT2 family glycosyltransferase
MLMNPKVAVSIVSYNCAEHLLACLDSVFQTGDGRVGQVCVVDNASSDGTVDRVRSRFPQAMVIANPRNRFFTEAHNQAFEATNSEYVLILNPDTLLRPETIASLERSLENNPTIAAVTCSLVDGQGVAGTVAWRQHNLRELIRRLYPFALWPRAWAQTGPADKGADLCYVEVVSDALILVRRSCLEQVGYYDTRFELYYTEDDLCVRLRAKGWRIALLPGVCAVHRGHRSTSKIGKMRHQCLFLRDMITYARSHLAFWSFAVLPIFAALDAACVAAALLYKRLRVRCSSSTPEG